MKQKNLAVVILTLGILFGFCGGTILRTKDTYSYSERRTLAQMPDISGKTLISGEFMTDFESFSLDQFPLRDTFRRVKAVAARYGMRQKDNNGLYTARGHLSKLEYPLNEGKLNVSMGKLQSVYEKYLKDTDCRICLSVIPDKNYYLAPQSGYPTMDYSAAVETVRSGLPFAEYIDIFGKLSLEDYYHTDQHWRQENILPVARTLADAMDAKLDADFTVNTLDYPFYGTYYGQAALPFQPDTIRYLTSDALEQCVVTSYSTGKPVSVPVYNMEKAASRDPYEMFLNGSEPLLVIENPSAAADKELIVFRDSFSSSLMPLMASGYSRITLVDLRYMRMDLLGDFVSFTDQDVLFLYSTLVLNQSVSM